MVVRKLETPFQGASHVLYGMDLPQTIHDTPSAESMMFCERISIWGHRCDGLPQDLSSRVEMGSVPLEEQIPPVIAVEQPASFASQQVIGDIDGLDRR